MTDKLKNLLSFLIIYLIILLGAIFTRLTEKLLLCLMLTIVISMMALTLIVIYMGLLKKEGAIITIMVIITTAIPFAMTYFIFLFVVYGFDIDKMKDLLKMY